jgi:hypothetical protein
MKQVENLHARRFGCLVVADEATSHVGSWKLTDALWTKMEPLLMPWSTAVHRSLARAFLCPP